MELVVAHFLIARFSCDWCRPSLWMWH